MLKSYKECNFTKQYKKYNNKHMYSIFKYHTFHMFSPMKDRAYTCREAGTTK